MIPTNSNLRVLDLFCGAGGFTLGLQLAGVSHSAVGIDSDVECAETYSLNFPQALAIVEDVHSVDFSSLPADVIVAGPPCQGFSKLNRNRDGDERNRLYLEVIRCVDAIRPMAVIVENVPNFLDAVEGRDLVARLQEMGYAVRTGVINCADYGVPQRRLRAVVSATLRGLCPPWPRQTHSERPSSNFKAHRTVGEALAFLPGPDGRNWHRPHSSRPAYESRFRAIPRGGNRRDLPPDLTLDCWKSTQGFSDVMGRLEWHRPANTIRTEFFRPEKGRFLHPEEDRPITAREAARLQSFPDTFVFLEEHSLQSVGRQIGNAMPPLAAKAIGSAIFSVLAGSGALRRAKRINRTSKIVKR
jgi:DNA (cytosine-5)-methyltransferase 1